LSDRPTLEQLLEVQEHFGLPGPALTAAMQSLKTLGDHLKKHQA